MQVDAAVIGAGIVGSSCAYFLARTGMRVCLLDRGGIAGGTSGSCEGNILVSDKVPGPELELAKLSCIVWRELAEDVPYDFEYENKGGIIVAETENEMAVLRSTVAAFRESGVSAQLLDSASLSDAEPHIAEDLAGGAFFPDDSQVQPMQAAAAFVRSALDLGAIFLDHERVTSISRDRNGAVCGLVTDRGSISTPCVVNAAGPWSGEISEMVGSHLPVQPRKGHIVVTEPLPKLIHHKVYEAAYGSTVNSNDSALQVASVAEGTRSGTILLGSSRQLKGFAPGVEIDVVQAIAQRAVRFFPVLARTQALRAYVGFRPFMPDHLPVMGEDPEVPGFYVITGHEGSGIGLGPVSSKLVSQLIVGEEPLMSLSAFQPARFTQQHLALA